ncbi:hypothetical protein QF032_000933 [Streptomyces achromogenes]|uniref:Uncharacterized protein n=2 Tax=Streptomyces achromogenes TaxID=67255 RepID=A0ABU0PU86_STRAH|nr:hypothetical protein [Streptomyces achromogenes]MDQ0829089.1 hypothetical protein [Streptomyces achromogenes]
MELDDPEAQLLAHVQLRLIHQDRRGRPIAISHAGAQVAARTVFQPDS